MKRLLFSIFALALTVNSKELSGQALVDFVDTNEEPLWVAKSIKPFLKSATPDEEEQFRVMDVKFIEIPPGTPTLEEEIKKINKIPEGIDPKSGKSFIAKEPIPQFFDARQKWPQCYTIGSIKQQSNCGSCWAVASAAVASDRMCINPPHYQMSLSAEDILSCCGRQCYPQEACLGGYPIRAMNWWVTNGIVTGGDYNDRQYCRPYTIPPCGYHNGTFQSCPPLFSAPRCHQQCQNGYQRNYNQDKYYASRAYHVPGDITTIQREIMEHGPVVATFIVYEDFRRYQRGIYHHTWGTQKGGHVVKIIGWGVEGQIPYWLAVNSWGTGWGDKGLFKILRGNNECGFEAAIVAALPRS